MKISLTITFAFLLCIANISAHTFVSAATIIAATDNNISQSLPGSWRLDKVESQGDQKVSSIETFKGQTIKLTKNGTYQFTANGSTDNGTWTVNANKEIEVVSKTMKTTGIFQVVSIDARTLVAKYMNGNTPIILTFSKAN